MIETSHQMEWGIPPGIVYILRRTPIYSSIGDQQFHRHHGYPTVKLQQKESPALGISMPKTGRLPASTVHTHCALREAELQALSQRQPNTTAAAQKQLSEL